MFPFTIRCFFIGCFFFDERQIDVLKNGRVNIFRWVSSPSMQRYSNVWCFTFSSGEFQVCEFQVCLSSSCCKFQFCYKIFFRSVLMTKPHSLTARNILSFSSAAQNQAFYANTDFSSAQILNEYEIRLIEVNGKKGRHQQITFNLLCIINNVAWQYERKCNEELNASKCTGSNYHLKMICFTWTKGDVDLNVMET